MSSTHEYTFAHDQETRQNSENLIVNGTFTDVHGNASTEPWVTQTTSRPVRIPGGKHQLSLFRAEQISQSLKVAGDQEFNVHYAFLAAASNPSPETYIRVRIENSLAHEEVDIVVNNKLLYLRTRTGTQRFSPRGGNLTMTFSNEIINSDRFINLTDIRLWIAPV